MDARCARHYDASLPAWLQAVRRPTLEVLKLRARAADSDPIRKIEKRIVESDFEWRHDLDEVSPGDVDPERPLNSVDCVRLNSLTVEEIEAL